MGLLDFLTVRPDRKKGHGTDNSGRTAAADDSGSVDNIDSISELETRLSRTRDDRSRFYLRRRLNRLCQEKVMEAATLQSCREFFDRIDAEDIMGSIAVRHSVGEIAVAAAARIASPEAVAKTLRLTTDKNIAAILLERPLPEETLRKLSGSVINNSVRKMVRGFYEERSGKTEDVAGEQQEYAVNRWKKPIDALEKICIEAENMATGSVSPEQSRLQTLRESWQNTPPPPPRFMEILEKRFSKACAEAEEAIRRHEEHIRRHNEQLRRMEEWCRRAEQLAEQPYSNSNALDFDALRDHWGGLSGALVERGPLAERFNRACGEFERKRKLAMEAELELSNELDSLSEELDSIKASGIFKEHSARVKAIRQQVNDDLRFSDEQFRAKVNKIRATCHEFFVKMKDFFEAAEYERCASALRKEDLCKAAEALLESSDFFMVSRRLKQLHAEWRDQGRAHREEEEILWSRFKAACDQLHQRCTGFFSNLHAVRQENMVRKKALVDEAKELVKPPVNWHEAAERLKEIQRQWRDIGAAPRQEEQETYKELRRICDEFFAQRKQHYEEMKEQWQIAEKRKEALIGETGKLYDLPFRAAVSLLRELREQWRDAGFVPQARETELHERFDAAVNAYFVTVDAEREENMRKKQELCEQSEQLFSETGDYNELHVKVDALMDEWKRIGPAPKDAESELWERFNAPMKKFHEQRREHGRKIEKQRMQAMVDKLHLIEKLEKIVGRQGNFSEDAEAVKALQHKWKETGTTFHDKEQELWTHFQGICNDFFNHRTEYFEKSRIIQEENHRKKIEICVELEKLAGINAPGNLSIGGAENLAEELEFAMRNGSVADLDHRQAEERAQHLLGEWKQTGFAGDQELQIYLRFERAREALFGQQHKNP